MTPFQFSADVCPVRPADESFYIDPHSFDMEYHDGDNSEGETRSSDENDSLDYKLDYHQGNSSEGLGEISDDENRSLDHDSDNAAAAPSPTEDGPPPTRLQVGLCSSLLTLVAVIGLTLVGDVLYGFHGGPAILVTPVEVLHRLPIQDMLVNVTIQATMANLGLMEPIVDPAATAASAEDLKKKKKDKKKAPGRWATLSTAHSHTDWLCTRYISGSRNLLERPDLVDLCHQFDTGYDQAFQLVSRLTVSRIRATMEGGLSCIHHALHAVDDLEQDGQVGSDLDTADTSTWRSWGMSLLPESFQPLDNSTARVMTSWLRGCFRDDWRPALLDDLKMAAALETGIDAMLFSNPYIVDSVREYISVTKVQMARAKAQPKPDKRYSHPSKNLGQKLTDAPARKWKQVQGDVDSMEKYLGDISDVSYYLPVLSERVGTARAALQEALDTLDRVEEVLMSLVDRGWALSPASVSTALAWPQAGRSQTCEGTRRRRQTDKWYFDAFVTFRWDVEKGYDKVQALCLEAQGMARATASGRR
ncbi:hypothetical protein QBC39DRAFT_360362 [Podospora conica]|nr:hypothetical protein QBC39DRAFT_360362 [Schizothecium conicum]